MTKFKIQYGSDTVSQFNLAGTGPDLAAAAQRRADASLKPTKPQDACDIGLFSDQSSQLDLVTLANTARKP